MIKPQKKVWVYDGKMRVWLGGRDFYIGKDGKEIK
jgi:hypothetical protein